MNYILSSLKNNKLWQRMQHFHPSWHFIFVVFFIGFLGAGFYLRVSTVSFLVRSTFGDELRLTLGAWKPLVTNQFRNLNYVYFEFCRYLFMPVALFRAAIGFWSGEISSLSTLDPYKVLQAIRIFNSFCSVFAFYLIAKAAKKSAGVLAALFVAAIYLFLDQEIYISVFAKPDAVQLLFSSLLIWYTVKRPLRDSQWEMIVLGIITGVALSVKVTDIIYIPLALGCVFEASITRRKGNYLLSFMANFFLFCLATAIIGIVTTPALLYDHASFIHNFFASNKNMLDYSQFSPVVPTFKAVFVNLFRHNSQSLVWIKFLCVLIGFVVLMTRNKEVIKCLAIVAVVFLYYCLFPLQAIQRYGFRYTVILSPLIVFLMAVGMSACVDFLKRGVLLVWARGNKKIGYMIGCIGVGFLLIGEGYGFVNYKGGIWPLLKRKDSVYKKMDATWREQVHLTRPLRKIYTKYILSNPEDLRLSLKNLKPQRILEGCVYKKDKESETLVLDGRYGWAKMAFIIPGRIFRTSPIVNIRCVSLSASGLLPYYLTLSISAVKSTYLHLGTATIPLYSNVELKRGFDFTDINPNLNSSESYSLNLADLLNHRAVNIQDVDYTYVSIDLKTSNPDVKILMDFEHSWW